MTTHTEAFADVHLPKWAGITVVGEGITPEQAQVLLVRTCGFGFWTNDRAFEAEVLRLVGVTADRLSPAQFDQIEEAEARYGVLDLEYLRNSRIASCDIAGPHGWCDWVGTIYMAQRNVGKHATLSRLLEEAETIAEAFPFLTMRLQVLDREWSELDASPVAEYVVEGAQATAQLWPEESLVPSFPPQAAEARMGEFAMGLLNPGRERGCTIALLEKALERTLASLENG